VEGELLVPQPNGRNGTPPPTINSQTRKPAGDLTGWVLGRVEVFTYPAPSPECDVFELLLTDETAAPLKH